MTVEDQTLIVQQQLRLSVRVRLLLGVVFLLLAIVVVAIFRLPPKLEAGQVIDQFGVYRFPSGGHQLEINKTAEGNVQIFYHRRVTEFAPFSIPIISNLTTDQPLTFEAERNWFVCVDRFERLWIYQGRWHKKWAPKRKMPSGGATQNTQGVFMEGLIFYRPGQLGLGGQIVSITGDWTGVPAVFFDRIPNKNQGTSVWGNIPPIPQSPPPFTKQQQTMLEQKLNALR